jgi:hypothetical protein
MSTIFVKEYAAPPVDIREVLRYAGVRESTPDMVVLANDCFAEAKSELGYRVCYAEFALAREDDGTLDLGFARVRSSSLCARLAECEGVIVFAATVGLALDRLIARYGTGSPSRAVMLDALGVERVEALCDAFCQEMAEQSGKTLAARFSPGYGDLPLEFQREIFRALDVPRRIGVSLGRSCLMSPSKSVTAIVGIKS